MKKLHIILLFATLTSFSVLIAAPRTWTDKTGTHKIEAEYVRYQDANVFLKKSNGRTVKISIDKLSVADQQWVRNQIQVATTRKVSVVTSANAKPANSKGDWAEWRGPDRTGISPETGLLDEWADDGPPLLWSAKGAGRGYSSVSLSGDRIFTMGNRGSGEELIAMNAADGEVVWTTPVGTGKDCNCTPTVDGNLVFGLGRDGDLICAETGTGQTVWKKNFKKDFRGKMMSGWGYSESPLVNGDRLICTPGSKHAAMAALDKRTGETIWETAMEGCHGAGYASPVISHGGGVKQYITLVGSGIISVAANDGRLLWHYKRIANNTANIPTPIVKDNYVFCSTGYGDGGTALLQLSKDGQGVTYREVYYKKSSELQNHHGGMILIGDHVFMGHGHNNGLPVCVELKTGKIQWGPLRGPGGSSAAIMAADGDLYFRYQDGIMALIEANPSEYKLKGKFKIASVNGNSWPHPVIANKKLYLRDQDELHCYDISVQ